MSDLAETAPDTSTRQGGPGPHTLLLGTYRDLWAGPVSELNPPLRFLAPGQRLELAAADADRLGLGDGDTATVSANGTSVEAAVAIRGRVREGACFLIEGTAEDNANLLANGAERSVRVEKSETGDRSSA